MTPVDQTLAHDPANGVWGNCMQACIASLLDLEIQDVPHFFDGGCEPHIFDKRVAEFLDTRGLMELTALPAYGRYVMRHRGQQCYHLIYGDTVRGNYHAVVGLNGEVVHDPHPSKAGIIENGNTQFAFLVSTGKRRCDRHAARLRQTSGE